MSQTMTGDPPAKRRRAAPKADDMSVDLHIGRIQGALKAHEDRMDRTDAAHADQFKMVNERFDGIKQHLNSQDTKLDLLVAKSNRDAGASDQLKKLALIGGGVLTVAATLIGALIEAHFQGFMQ
jgi:hypothetical protein